MLFSRYHNPEYILKMAYLDGVELLDYAIEKINEDMLVKRWITNYEKQGVSFLDFKKKVSESIQKKRYEKIIDLRKEEDILKDVETILSFERR